MTLFALSLLGGTSFAATERFALLAGANDGGPDRAVLEYAVDDAESVASVLTELGGFLPDDTLVLVEPDPAELRTGVDQIIGLVAEADARGNRTEVFVYYSGHSDEEGLLLSGEDMAYTELRTLVEDIPSDVRILVLDSCASGAIVRQKGGVHRAPFLLDESVEVRGTALLTSASADEAAQEGARIGGSYFTHALVTGLRGGADTSGDSRVTLNEVYQFAYTETLATTERTMGGAQHANYDIQMVGSGDLVLTDVSATNAALVVGSGLEGRLFIRDADENLVAELFKPSDRVLELGLSPGRYTVLLENEGLSEAVVTLTDGDRVELTADLFTSVRGEATVSRGGDVERVPVSFGALTSFLAKRSGDEVHNLDISFVATWAPRLRGVQLALGTNVTTKDMHGLQATTGVNVAKGTATGLQLSSGVNVAQEIRGAQLGLINVSGHHEGVQLGLINVSRDADVSIALIPIVIEGTNHIQLGAHGPDATLGIQLGGKKLYTLWEIGYRLGEDQPTYVMNLGLGWHTQVTDQVWFDVDAVAGEAQQGFIADESDVLAVRGRATVGYALKPRLGAFIGPTAQFAPINESDRDLPGLTSGPLTFGLSGGLRF